jgi:hypothetical protein
VFIHVIAHRDFGEYFVVPKDFSKVARFCECVQACGTRHTRKGASLRCWCPAPATNVSYTSILYGATSRIWKCLRTPKVITREHLIKYHRIYIVLYTCCRGTGAGGKGAGASAGGKGAGAGAGGKGVGAGAGGKGAGAGAGGKDTGAGAGGKAARIVRLSTAA